MADKERQSIELLERVKSRLLESHRPRLALAAPEHVMMFLLCMEEMEKMKQEEPPGS